MIFIRAKNGPPITRRPLEIHSLFVTFILSAHAQDSTLKGSFGNNCVDTFKGPQCESMLEVSYDETQVSIKTFGLNEGRSVNEYKGHNPNHEIYWVTADKHLTPSSASR